MTARIPIPMVGLAMRQLGALLADFAVGRAVPPRADVQRGIATAGAFQDMGANLAAAAEMFPQHTKTSAPGVCPVVAERPGPVSLDELRARTSGPGHSTSAARRAAVGPGSATPHAGPGSPRPLSDVLRDAAFVIAGATPFAGYLVDELLSNAALFDGIEEESDYPEN